MAVAYFFTDTAVAPTEPLTGEITLGYLGTWINSVEPVARKPKADDLPPRRRQPFHWEAWSNQFHDPGYRVYKPVYRQTVRAQRCPRRRATRTRRARLCSSPVQLMPY
jgi:hypothetical protein